MPTDIEAVAKKINSPWINLAVIVTMAATMVAGIQWGLPKIEAAEEKADSANAAVKEVKGAMDTFIMLQREANELKREEMKAQGIRVQTRTVSTSESMTQSESSTQESSRSVEVLRSGSVIIEYEADSLRNGIIRKGDTIFIPKPQQDTAGTRPR